MKYHNLVYCKHHASDARAYLYELPLDADVKTGDRLCVKDRHGEHIVTAHCENWLASAKMTEVLCVCNGGYYPPAQVIGRVNTVTIRQDVTDYFNGGVGLEEPEGEQPWF